MHPLIAAPGPWEIALILLVVLMFFGATKLPELARGTGRALRIFKSETKGLMDDDEEEDSTSTKSDTGELGSSSEQRNSEQPTSDDVSAAESQRDTTN